MNSMHIVWIMSTWKKIKIKKTLKYNWPIIFHKRLHQLTHQYKTLIKLLLSWLMALLTLVRWIKTIYLMVMVLKLGRMVMFLLDIFCKVKKMELVNWKKKTILFTKEILAETKYLAREGWGYLMDKYIQVNLKMENLREKENWLLQMEKKSKDCSKKGNMLEVIN